MGGSQEGEKTPTPRKGTRPVGVRGEAARGEENPGGEVDLVRFFCSSDKKYPSREKKNTRGK